MIGRCLVVLSIGLAVAACGLAERDPVSAALSDRLGLASMSAAIDRGDHGAIEAVVVEQGGAIVFEDYFGSTDPETIIDVRSVGKSITALAVGLAITDGGISDVDALMLDAFADLVPIAGDGPVKRAITVHDLLSMSSALDCTDWRRSPGNEERMYRSPDWTRFALDIAIDTAFVRAAGGQGRFSYCTSGVLLLGRMVERGVDGALWRRSPAGEVQSGAQLGLRARDLARIGRMTTDGGAWRDQQIVPRDWLREVLEPRVQATPALAYGYLWWFGDFDVGDGTASGGAFMLGNGGNVVLLLPEWEAVIVVLASNYRDDDAYTKSKPIIEESVVPALAAIAAVSPRPPSPPR
ncbi:MAG: serine hydrolase [Pseudomonadota bacterium]